MSEALPPLPDDFEPHFYRLFNKINELADKVKVRRPGSFARTVRVHDPSKPKETFELLIPGHRAGLIIGQSGEALKRLEKMSNVNIKFDPHFSKDIGGIPHRKALLFGHSEDIEEAKRLINEKLDNKTTDPRFPTVYVSVPVNRVGLVIGKGGDTIRELQEKSGAKVQLVQENVVDNSSTERFISITGEPSNIEKAKQMVNDLVYQTGRAGAFVPGLSSIHGHSIVVQVPEAAVGAIIGRRAENLKSLQSASATRIFVDTSPNATGPTRSVTISGPTAESLIYAQQLLDERVSSHMATVEGTLGLDPSQPGFIYQSPSELFADSLNI